MLKNKPQRTRVLAMMTTALLFMMPLMTHAATADQWYKDHAKRMLEQMQVLLDDAAYMKTYASMPEAQTLASQWHTALLERQPAVHLFPTPTLEQVLRLAGEGAMLASVRGMGEVARKRMEEVAVGLLHNLVLSQNQSEAGVGMMIAGNALTLSDLAEVPADFENTLLLYEYDTFVIVVSFVDRGQAVLISTLISSPAYLETLQRQP